MRKINPRLIYCSISGYGQSGPAAERAAYAMIVHAESGFDRSLMRYAGDRDRPATGAIFVADVLGGIFGFSAIQTALVHRARTGEGQRIDVALMDCMLNLLVYELQEAQFPVHASRPTYGPVRTLDGDILIAPITPRNFAALCEVTGQSELADDPRFNTVPARGANWTAMMQVIEKWTERHTVKECMAALDRAGVPCAGISRSRRGADRSASPAARRIRHHRGWGRRIRRRQCALEDVGRQNRHASATYPASARTGTKCCRGCSVCLPRRSPALPGRGCSGLCRKGRGEG